MKDAIERGDQAIDIARVVVLDDVVLGLGLPLSAAISFDHATVPWPTSAQPPSFLVSPAGAMSLTCTDVMRFPSVSIQAKGSAPPRTTQAISASQEMSGRTFEDTLDRQRTVRELDEFEVVIVPAELIARVLERLAHFLQALAEGEPAGAVGRALVGGQMRRIDRIHAEHLGNVQRLLDFAVEEIGAEVAGRHHEAVLVEIGAQAFQTGIVKIGIDAAEAFDFRIAGLAELFEDRRIAAGNCGRYKAEN